LKTQTGATQRTLDALSILLESAGAVAQQL
jgi:hypothetical protein